MTVDCVCEQNGDNTFVLDQLLLTLKWTLTLGDVGGFYHLTLLAGGVGVYSADLAGGGSGSVVVDLADFHPPAWWLEHWDTVGIAMGGDASTLVGCDPPPANPAIFKATWNIRQIYKQGDSNFTSWVAMNIDSGKTSCPDRSQIVWGRGAAAMLFLCHTPLGECNGVSFESYNFQPYPLDNLVAGITNPCLCIEGGTPPFQFDITGELPCGMYVDPTTGCLNGTADGSCTGTECLMWKVTDVNGDSASVNCCYARACDEIGNLVGNFGY